MKAVEIEAGHVFVREVPKPTCPPGFALLRTIVGGICNTDLELQRGYYGFAGIPGHEFVGEVEESDDRSLAGKRVVGDINLACGHCDFCAIGLGRHCRNRSVLGILRHPGAFAEWLVLPEANLHVIPDEILNEQAVFVEPLAAACEIHDQIPIPLGERVAILGDGKLGLLVTQTMRAYGAEVVLYGRHEEKLKLVRGAGVETVAAGRRPGGEFAYVVDCTGSSAGLREAIRMARPRGIVVMKSTIHGEVAIDAAGAIVNEITLVGSRCGRFEPAIELLRSGQVKVDAMISAEFPLSEAQRAFEEARLPGVLKVLLRTG